MIDGPDPWRLPGAQSFLEALSHSAGNGLAVIGAGWRPRGLETALGQHLARRFQELESVRPGRGESPAACLVEPFGAAPSLDGVVSHALDGCVALVILDQLDAADLAEWTVFIQRFAPRRREEGRGLALVLMGGKLPEAAPCDAHRWTDHVRRGDLVIWAEQHLPAEREGLAAELAVALAVELCAERLDLAAALVRARIEDIADAIRWHASQRAGQGERPGSDGQDIAKLKRRVWRAELVALFPWIEEFRLQLVEQHRGALRIDDHLRGLGVHDVDEIELGSIGWQLKGRLAAPDIRLLDCVTRVRNALAHRKPASAEDVRALLAAAAKLEGPSPRRD